MVLFILCIYIVDLFKIMSTFIAKTLFSQANRRKCMENFNRVEFPHTKKVSPTAKAAAVLLPICGINDQACLFYAVRSIEGRDDTGRVSFPGGFCDNDETPVNTALRETQHDTGLDMRQVEVWGVAPTISDINHTHLVKPVIGSVLHCNPDCFKLNTKKILEAFTIPLELLCDPSTHFYTQYKNGSRLPVFKVDKYKIWGTTAFLTHILLGSLLPKAAYNNEWMNEKTILQNNKLILE